MSIYVGSTLVAGSLNDAVDLAVETLSGTVALVDNSARGIIAGGAITFTLPSITDYTELHQIFVQLKMTTVYAINLGLGTPAHWLTEQAPDLSKAGTYNIYWEYDNINHYWKASAMKQGASS